MPPPTNKRGSGPHRPVHRWHRNTGIIAAFGLLYLLTTGLPLQFSAQLTLGQRFVTTDWVLDWYGVEAPHTVTSSGEVVHIGGFLYLGNTLIRESLGHNLDRLTGAITTDTTTVIAGTDRVVLLHRTDPQRPETIRIDAPIIRLGQAAGQLFVDTRGGLKAADRALVNWRSSQANREIIQWAPVSTLTAPAASTYRRAFRARMITVERWLQDLHSGRFFGAMGVAVVDVLSLLLVFLATTGLILWWRYPRG